MYHKVLLLSLFLFGLSTSTKIRQIPNPLICDIDIDTTTAYDDDYCHGIFTINGEMKNGTEVILAQKVLDPADALIFKDVTIHNPDDIQMILVHWVPYPGKRNEERCKSIAVQLDLHKVSFLKGSGWSMVKYMKFMGRQHSYNFPPHAKILLKRVE